MYCVASLFGDCQQKTKGVRDKVSQHDKELEDWEVMTARESFSRAPVSTT